MVMRGMLMDILIENVKVSDHFDDLVIYGKLMLNTLSLQKIKWKVWLDLFSTG
jgi:hypothetical protein